MTESIRTGLERSKRETVPERAKKRLESSLPRKPFLPLKSVKKRMNAMKIAKTGWQGKEGEGEREEEQLSGLPWARILLNKDTTGLRDKPMGRGTPGPNGEPPRPSLQRQGTPHKTDPMPTGGPVIPPDQPCELARPWQGPQWDEVLRTRAHRARLVGWAGKDTACEDLLAFSGQAGRQTPPSPPSPPAEAANAWAGDANG